MRSWSLSRICVQDFYGFVQNNVMEMTGTNFRVSKVVYPVSSLSIIGVLNFKNQCT